MAIRSRFNPLTGTLETFDDGLDGNIVIGRNAAGQLLVNGGAVPILGGTPTVANTALIQVFGQGGDDTITLDESNGALPRANIFGGAGNDAITGGSGGDMLFGQAGNDTILGRGGSDFLFGGAGNDTLTGGDGDDQVFGQGGDDRMIWNPGDDTDLFEGGAGNDTAEVNGGGGAEVFTATANGSRVRFDRLDPAPFALDLGTTERLVVNMNGGNDTFSATGNLAALIIVTVDGGDGDDTIFGSNGVDTLLGGDGNDFIDGQQGNDVAFLGAGDDVFQWDPGDGSDTVEGQDGVDQMLFNGSNGNENFAVSANGQRVLLTRNLGNIVMDLDGVEDVTINALGGDDNVAVNDLNGTDVTEVNVNLAGTNGGTAGDGRADNVRVDGTNGGNEIDIFGAGTSVSVVGLSAQVNISNAEGANDRLIVQGLGGNDTITATTLPAGVMQLTLDGGAGDDTLLGSQGADVLIGGDGDDFVFGDNGNDVAFLGAGDDVFQWNPGDGNDTVEGQDGFDNLLFFGANIAENVTISANGGRATLFRDIANVTMDLDGVESIDFRGLGGADNIVVGDLSGTDVTEVNIDLRGPNGGPDGATDSVTVSATNGDDVFGVTGDAGGVRVFGLQAVTNMFHTDAEDRLTLNGLGGDDVINASSLEAGAVQLTMNGGLGDDTLIGSEGDDLINGGDGNDTALMGAGDDTFVWNPGDDNDTIEGQAGFDTMQFNGSNAAENITLSANGGRALFTRDIANVTMDLNDVEQVNFRALGGADTVTINDMSGTDVTRVAIDLGASGGGGDGQADTIIINATNGDDVVLVTGADGTISVLGLATEVDIFNFEAARDRLIINTLGGDDVIEGSSLGAGLALTANGGNGDDVMVGGEGNDVFDGGAGDDVLVGGLGLDILNGGLGDNVIIQ
jgi:Ca2+-binding RTX toxin-like protein